MAQDLDEMMQKAPTLTLDPFGEEKAAVAEKEPEPLVKEEEVNLSPEERRMVEEFAAKIDLHSSNMILQYGAGAQKTNKYLPNIPVLCFDLRQGL